MGDQKKDLKISDFKVIKDTLKMIIKAEKTTTGRVNLTGVILAFLVSFYSGEVFTFYGFVIIVVLIMSAIISDRTRKRRGY